MIRAALRHQYQVRVWHAVAVHQISDAFRCEHFAHASADALRKQHDVLGRFIRHIGEVIDVRFRNDEAFTRGGRLNAHECGNGCIFVNETDRRAARENFAEDAAHWGLLSVTASPVT